jgi:hypothetical protein
VAAWRATTWAGSDETLEQGYFVWQLLISADVIFPPLTTTVTPMLPWRLDPVPV